MPPPSSPPCLIKRGEDLLTQLPSVAMFEVGFPALQRSRHFSAILQNPVIRK
ncbi:MAG: hypothetical protein K6T90_14385 [Leptolyngbyaceae cyanobacterium HOT.MB2.61]|nr:hypothetical protein [Leptolyngbyaceae cyanobacterium HOT.MB2.61]